VYIILCTGQAYHSLRSRSKILGETTLFPCFGLKTKGDQISIRPSSWLSRRGLDVNKLLRVSLDSLGVLSRYRDFMDAAEGFSLDDEAELYRSYKRRHEDNSHVIMSRAGLEVTIDASADSVPETFCPLRRLKVGDTLRSRQGVSRVVGYTPDRLWYTVDSCILGAWFWTSSEFNKLLAEATVSFIDEESTSGLVYFDQPVSPEVTTLMEATTFELSLRRPWTRVDSLSFVRFINDMADRYNLNPVSIPLNRVLSLWRKSDVLTDYSEDEIASRYVFLCALSRAASNAIPLIDFGWRCAPLICSEYETALESRYTVDVIGGRMSSMGEVYAAVKEMIFTRTKQAIWTQVNRETTTATAAPGDEFDRPDDIVELSVNRLEAKTLLKSPVIVPFNERLSKSVLGQLMNKMAILDNRAMRRSYEDTMDDGQSMKLSS
jgi:hypothetical protein